MPIQDTHSRLTMYDLTSFQVTVGRGFDRLYTGKSRLKCIRNLPPFVTSPLIVLSMYV